jgi:hypothetical protein
MCDLSCGAILSGNGVENGYQLVESGIPSA